MSKACLVEFPQGDDQAAEPASILISTQADVRTTPP
jgi:hypothetical protein